MTGTSRLVHVKNEKTRNKVKVTASLEKMRESHLRELRHDEKRRQLHQEEGLDHEGAEPQAVGKTKEQTDECTCQRHESVWS